MIAHHLISVGYLAYSKLVSVSLFHKRENDQFKIVARLRRAADLVMHPLRHRHVVMTLAPPVFQTIRRKQPQLPLKYLHPRYLARGISTGERSAAFIEHYRFLEARFSPAILQAVLAGDLCVWRFTSEGRQHRILLKFSDPTDNEGELTLEYRLDGAPIYLVSFSFVPGRLVHSPAETAVLVSRIQGAKGDFMLIRDAMKAVRGLGGPAILMAALQGIAEGFGLRELTGVSAEAQVCNDDGPSSDFTIPYDNFFLSIGASRASPQFYRIALPLHEKPISDVRSSNRARTKAQRELKRAIRLSSRTVVTSRSDAAEEGAGET